MARSDVVCSPEAKRQMWVAWRTGLPGTWCPGVHANCIHNEIAALRLRSMAETPMGLDCPLSGEVVSVFRRLRALARRYDQGHWSYLETAHTYTGLLQRRYVEAERSLREDGPLDSRDARLRAFLKAEKLGAASDAKPRMIFPRSPRFNLVLASRLKPFEHWLWGFLTAKRLFGGSNTRVVAKGLGPKRRANLIRRKLGGFVDGVCFEVDGKAFEAHVSASQVSEEHGVYRAAFPGDSVLAGALCRQVFAGRTASGVKFARPGGRASGDFNTGMGNSLIMLAVVTSVLKSLVNHYDVLVDGDNALVFLERRSLDRVLHNFARRVLDWSGHEMVLERPVSVVEEIRFGRSAPVWLGPELGWTMVREPWSVLSGAYASHRWLREPRFGRRWVSGVARCELSLAVGVPVLQAAALSVLSQTADVKRVPVEALRDYFVVGGFLAEASDVRPVTVEARLSFEKAFGLSPWDQLLWEQRVGCVRVGSPVGVIPMPKPSLWWDAEPGLFESYVDAH